MTQSPVQRPKARFDTRLVASGLLIALPLSAGAADEYVASLGISATVTRNLQIEPASTGLTIIEDDPVVITAQNAVVRSHRSGDGMRYSVTPLAPRAIITLTY